ncbi:glyoxylase-like metal-dependent hydrolase (beta-lactamase superfamily II) [Paraperlucidibaca baekdonensis]|uniref:Glyoxylase-like metal-dependent hydrolase (Beta-lactamase superfamily II) n=1 Tax=Paraperlucidibaca baekdonensis TaxID=748120 RepID=A0A3E0H9Q8_9GAMM|nr:MBL fold metallo-hydrolase [Paraperlucidibaca baekdonensis]REH40448.1 glyoxylase-like metal-dependent hydrolase (beta-lactamase superfamily II) [Paraperlucidibaca baekdonensis]
MALRFRIHPVTPFEQNCSLIWCDATNEAALIDAGGDADQLLALVKAEGVTLTKLLVTHAHIDHAGAVADLAEHLHLPIEGPHTGDQFWIDRLDDQSRMFQFPSARPFTPSRWLEQGNEVTVGAETLLVRHCPGHTPGHVVFISESAGVSFVGDVLFAGSIGRTDFPMGNHQDLLDAIKRELWPLPDDMRFVPGHGPMSTIGHERRTNPFVADRRG